MSESIVITGAGVVSAIGVGQAETLSALLKGQSGIGEIKYLSTRHHELPVGEVKLTNEAMMQMLGLDNDPLLSRTVLLGRLALREALEQAGLTGDRLSEVHLVSGTTVGGMDRRELHHAQEPECDKTHALVASHNCGNSTEQVADFFGNFASLGTVSTACSSATNAIITGANMLRCGLADIVAVGGSECLSQFHLNGFNTLMNLDHQPCKPFDQHRDGLNLGEGAAYLVMETEASARKRGVKPLCRLSGYGNACDAFHQTASSPEGEGAYRAMKEALEVAGLAPGDIQYVNAHGTGTVNNDECESQALIRIYGDQMPPVSSTKAFTGHTTSASGSIEAVICMLALEHQFLPQNLNWQQPMENGIVPCMEQQPKAEIKHIMSNAFGFGGNDSSLIISKYGE